MPVVNLFGFIEHSRYVPADQEDLNRSFPGNWKSPLSKQLAKCIYEEVITHCSHGIDLHSGANNRFKLPQIRTDMENETCIEMAKAFGAPIVQKADRRKGPLRGAAKERSIPTLLFEGSEAGRFDDAAAEIGCRGIIRVMDYLGMLNKDAPVPKAEETIISEESYWERTPQDGIFRSCRDIKPGVQLEKGRLIGTISYLFGEPVVDVRRPQRLIDFKDCAVAFLLGNHYFYRHYPSASGLESSGSSYSPYFPFI